jgi:hypothetical protein
MLLALTFIALAMLLLIANSHIAESEAENTAIEAVVCFRSAVGRSLDSPWGEIVFPYLPNLLVHERTDLGSLTSANPERGNARATGGSSLSRIGASPFLVESIHSGGE